MTSEACPSQGTGSRGVWLAEPLPRVRGLSGQAKILLGLMESLATKSGLAYAALELYAERIGRSTRQTRKLLRVLERKGYIEAVGKRTGGRNLTTEYRIMPWRRKAEQVFPVSQGQKAEQKGAERRNTTAVKAEQKGSEPGTGVPPSSIEVQNSTKGREEGSAPASVPPTVNGNGKADSLNALARKAWERSPHPPGQTVENCERDILGHIAKGNYTVKALADFLAATETPGPFWEFHKAIPRFLEHQNREVRDLLAALFAPVKVGWTATRKDGTARGTVHLKVTRKITVKVTEPETEYPDITTREEFDRWNFGPSRSEGEAQRSLPMPHQTHQDGSVATNPA